MGEKRRNLLLNSFLTGCLSLSACQASGPAEVQVKPGIKTVKPSLPAEVQPLMGRVFQWVVSFPENDGPVRPENPEDYQLRFASPDRISLKADCNQYAGPVRLTATVFSVGSLIGTKALCAKGSLEGVYIRGIKEASGWTWDGDTLILTLPHDGGSMHFEEVTESQ